MCLPFPHALAVTGAKTLDALLIETVHLERERESVCWCNSYKICRILKFVKVLKNFQSSKVGLFIFCYNARQV